MRRERQRVLVHERVMKHDVCAFEKASSANGEKIGRARTGPDQIHDPLPRSAR
jgi:hypothetical protein